jgi:hypothetical protein
MIDRYSEQAAHKRTFSSSQGEPRRALPCFQVVEEDLKLGWNEATRRINGVNENLRRGPLRQTNKRASPYLLLR